MPNQHPITPPPELVQQWWKSAPEGGDWLRSLATQAAQWGADQELEACCEWLESINLHTYALRAARRPKPPSLKARLTEAIQNEDLDTALRLVDGLDDSL